MNIHTRWYNEHINTFPPKSMWAGTPEQYIKEIDDYRAYIIKTVENFVALRKAKDIQIRAGKNGNNLVAIMSFEGELTEEEKN